MKDIMIASSKTPAPSFVFKEFGHVITDSSAMPKSSNENDLDGGTNRLPTKEQSRWHEEAKNPGNTMEKNKY
jgi:hypothetical protein